MTVALDSLLYESVAVLEGLPMLKERRPKVVFVWRNFFKRTCSREPIGPPRLDCSLLRLPRWMQFEIVIGSKSDWIKKDELEKWLDAYCPNKNMRNRILVRTQISDLQWMIED